jgi:tRNA 2-selenouridine synthase
MTEIDDLATLLRDDTPLIDTRSPVEFAKGSLPTAINLPLMTDEEREAVGTCYKEQGQDAAVRLGHELVAGDLKEQRVGAWKTFVAQHPRGALFCFRGGMRSEIAQRWLKDAGVDYPRIKGGYKAMRRWLTDSTDQLIEKTPILLLGGPTGAAKTRILNEGNGGGPIPGSVDLEGLANHRGSAFGRRVTEQPTQIGFELALGVQLLKHRHAGRQKLLLEDEGRLIGRCALPLSLQAARHEADWVQLDASVDARVEHSYENYILQNLEDLMTEDAARAFDRFATGLLESLERIQKRLGGQRYAELKAVMQDALAAHERGNPEAHKAWISELLTDYYDPMYDYQMNNRTKAPLFRGTEQEVIEYLLQTEDASLVGQQPR